LFHLLLLIESSPLPKIGTGIYEVDFAGAEKYRTADVGFLSKHEKLPQEYTFHRTLNNEEFALIKSGKKGLYFYGTINYIDEFDKSRYTKWGVQYDTSGSIWSKYHNHN
jgi:hypothetical protein